MTIKMSFNQSTGANTSVGGQGSAGGRQFFWDRTGNPITVQTCLMSASFEVGGSRQRVSVRRSSDTHIAPFGGCYRNWEAVVPCGPRCWRPAKS